MQNIIAGSAHHGYMRQRLLCFSTSVDTHSSSINSRMIDIIAGPVSHGYMITEHYYGVLPL